MAARMLRLEKCPLHCERATCARTESRKCERAQRAQRCVALAFLEPADRGQGEVELAGVSQIRELAA